MWYEIGNLLIGGGILIVLLRTMVKVTKIEGRVNYLNHRTTNIEQYLKVFIRGGVIGRQRK